MGIKTIGCAIALAGLKQVLKDGEVQEKCKSVARDVAAGMSAPRFKSTAMPPRGLRDLALRASLHTLPDVRQGAKKELLASLLEPASDLGGRVLEFAAKTADRHSAGAGASEGAAAFRAWNEELQNFSRKLTSQLREPGDAHQSDETDSSSGDSDAAPCFTPATSSASENGNLEQPVAPSANQEPRVKSSDTPWLAIIRTHFTWPSAASFQTELHDVSVENYQHQLDTLRDNVDLARGIGESQFELLHGELKSDAQRDPTCRKKCSERAKTLDQAWKQFCTEHERRKRCIDEVHQRLDRLVNWVTGQRPL